MCGFVVVFSGVQLYLFTFGHHFSWAWCDLCDLGDLDPKNNAVLATVINRLPVNLTWCVISFRSNILCSAVFPLISYQQRISLQICRGLEVWHGCFVELTAIGQRICVRPAGLCRAAAPQLSRRTVEAKLSNLLSQNWAEPMLAHRHTHTHTHTRCTYILVSQSNWNPRCSLSLFVQVNHSCPCV